MTVAKPAPPDAPLKALDYSQGAGPRFEDNGNLVPHSILGTVEDYKKMAHLNGDLPPVSVLGVYFHEKKKNSSFPASIMCQGDKYRLMLVSQHGLHRLGHPH